MNKKIELIAKRIDYLSSLDEETFFAWLERISCVVEKRGIADELHVYVDQTKLSESDLRELLALFYRYEIDMKQLRIFLNKDNKSWLDRKETF